MSRWRIILQAAVSFILGSLASAAPWNQTTSLPDGYGEHALAYRTGFIYQTGGVSSNNYDADGVNVFYAQVQTNGTLGTWNSATSLPAPVQDHASVVANGYLYVLGGEHTIGFPSTAVYYAKINTDGTIGAWQTANDLPHAVFLLGGAVWNNTIYVTGGYDGHNATNGVYSATIQSDGSLSSWVAQTPMPNSIYAHSTVANGALYVLGGIAYPSGGSPQNLTNAYYSKINPDGSLAGWNSATGLPMPLNRFASVATGGRVYVCGGLSVGIATNGVYHAIVQGDGSLSAWVSDPLLPQSVSSLAAATTGSWLFVSGGEDNLANPQPTTYSMQLPAAPTVPVLTSQGILTNHNYQLRLTSSTNIGFAFQASTNLSSWTNVGWGFTGTNGVLIFQDTNASRFPRRFYRAYWPLP